MKIKILFLLLVLRLYLCEKDFFRRKSFTFQGQYFISLDYDSTFQFSEFSDVTTYINQFFGGNVHTPFSYACGEVSINGPVQVFPNYYVYTTPTTGSQSRIFYWLVSAKGTDFTTNYDPTKPVILWMQGGPGCGSTFGFASEMGPFRAYTNSSKQIQFEENPYTWAMDAYMIFIDQPISVGLSVVVGNDTGEVLQTNNTEIAVAVVEQWLEQLFSVKQLQLLKQNPLYIMGESYAGHYVPALASRILVHKQQGLSDINLVGIAVGDGWTEPLLQNQAYSPYMYSAGIISTYRMNQWKWFTGNIAQNILTGKLLYCVDYQLPSYPAARAGSYCFDGSTTPTCKIAITQTNVLNYRQYFQDYPSQDAFQTWIQQDNTYQNLKLPKNASTNFQFCSNLTYFSFLTQASKNYAGNYSIILPQIPVLIYEGQADPDVSNNGVQYMMKNIVWDQMDLFLKTQKQVWYDPITGNVIGNSKVYGNLRYIMVNDAGHLVPHDQPKNAQLMIRKFLNQQWYQGGV